MKMRVRKKHAKREAHKLGLTPLWASGNQLVIREEMTTNIERNGYEFISHSKVKRTPTKVHLTFESKESKKDAERVRKDEQTQRRVATKRQGGGGGY